MKTKMVFGLQKSRITKETTLNLVSFCNSWLVVLALDLDKGVVGLKSLEVTQSDYAYPETFEELLPWSPEISRYLKEKFNGHVHSTTMRLITSEPFRNLLA
ncbi:hypothetical protein Tco_1558068 [Tanacetum coccineum]